VEFPLADEQLRLSPGMRVLDVAGPQWFSLAMAHRRPDVRFTYLNILEEEIEEARPVAEALGLRNLDFAVGDCRAMAFEAGSFDAAVSISALEHVAPDVGGDVRSVREIARVLKPGAALTLSLPCWETRTRVYDGEHPVWERGTQPSNFYMRVYDPAQVRELAEEADMALRDVIYVLERPGRLSMDYWELGPGRGRPEKNGVVRLKKKIDKLIGLRLEGILAARYLRAAVQPREGYRIIDAVATFVKP
jgi:SAM-dependent methyltransferase